jgi:hypothetical protein
VRADIEKYLGTVAQSTAKTISQKLGMHQRDVSLELNGMVNDGLLEREMRKGEYVYWLSRAEARPAETVPSGVSMHPSTASVAEVAVPKGQEPVARTVTATSDLAPQLQALTRERDDLKGQVADLEDKASVLQLKLDRETAAHHETRATCDKLRDMLDQCQLSRDQWKAKHNALELQIEQYEERKRFDAKFGSRPADVREAMWESWLERSKEVEVAA